MAVGANFTAQLLGLLDARDEAFEVAAQKRQPLAQRRQLEQRLLLRQAQARVVGKQVREVAGGFVEGGAQGPPGQLEQPHVLRDKARPQARVGRPGALAQRFAVAGEYVALGADAANGKARFAAHDDVARAVGVFGAYLLDAHQAAHAGQLFVLDQ